MLVSNTYNIKYTKGAFGSRLQSKSNGLKWKSKWLYPLMHLIRDENQNEIRILGIRF